LKTLLQTTKVQTAVITLPMALTRFAVAIALVGVFVLRKQSKAESCTKHG
jgi:hypothetical protein